MINTIIKRVKNTLRTLRDLIMQEICEPKLTLLRWGE